MLAFLLALALGGTQPAPARAPAPRADVARPARTPMVAAVRVNGVDPGLIVEFIREGDLLFASGSDLRELGIDVAAGTAEVRLRDVPGLTYGIDEATQTVAIRVPPSAMRVAQVTAPVAAAEEMRPAWGGLLNYSVYADAAGGGGATGELRLFGPVGALSGSVLVRRDPGRGGVAVRRLETSFVREDPARLRRLTIGDLVATDGSADGAIRAAGIQVATDFALQPDLVTAPIPHLAGGSGVPSTVDLYVDGVRRLTRDVGTGRFAVSGVPMVDGAGQVSLLVRDVLGRETVQQISFYSSRQLLRPGLGAGAFQFGVERAYAFGPGDRYGAAFASGTLRRGLSDRLTGEIRGALAARAQVAGASVTTKIGQLAILSFGGDVSGSARGPGGEAGLAIRRDGKRASLFVAAQKTFGSFETLASRYGSLAGWRLQAGASWQTAALGGFSVSATMLERDRARTRIVAASWSRPVASRLTAFLNAAATRAGGGRQLLVTAGLTVALSPRSAASAQTSYDSHGASSTASWSRSADPAGGVSWRASAATGAGQSRLQGGATFRGSAGEIGADVQIGRYGPAAQVFASGAAVWLGTSPRLAARIGQGFAVVQTGRPDVGVTLENRPAGRTRRDGSLLLPDLPANVAARIALDYDGIDLDHEAERTGVAVRMRGSGGVVVSMPVRDIRAATLRIVDEAGRPLPLGAIVRRPDGREDVVGYDGAAYLAGVAGAGSAEVIDGDRRCGIAFARGDAQVVCH